MDSGPAMTMMRVASSSSRFCFSPNHNRRSLPIKLFPFRYHRPDKHLLLAPQCILFQSPTPDPSSPLPCAAVTSDLVPSKLQSLVYEFQSLSEPADRVTRLLRYATLLPRLPDSARVDSNRVMGCTAQVELQPQLSFKLFDVFAYDLGSCLHFIVLPISLHKQRKILAFSCFLNERGSSHSLHWSLQAMASMLRAAMPKLR